MDDETKKVIKMVGLEFNELIDLDGLFIPREQLLDNNKYHEIKPYILNLKSHYSSSFMTSLQKTASINQKWPLLNLVRQILSVYNFKMVPIRKADGYTVDGVKKYKRFFVLTHISKDINNSNDNNITIVDNVDNVDNVDIENN